MRKSEPTVLVVMGVSGSGKTTVGRLLAERLGWPFHDADDFHPPANVEKMRGGTPLSGADRLPWLERLRELISGVLARGGSAVLACSALTKRYRRILAGGDPRVLFLYLHLGPRVLAERLEARQGHFFGPDLLESQLATLEIPAEGVHLDAALPPEDLVGEIRRRLGL